MKSTKLLAAAAGVLAGFMASTALAQAPAAPLAGGARDFDAEYLEALRAAKAAAGQLFLGILASNCVAPSSGGVNTSNNLPAYIQDPSRVPPREAWYADSAKVFDNLYFVGGSVHSSWALTTSEGIILIDTIYPYNSEELIIGGLERLGLNPADIKYVVISHAHGDHIGGAQILQERYGAQVVMGGPDWDLVETYPNRYATMAPTRDIVATDGMELTLGDTTLNIFETPGHTPGTLSYVFTVYDNGEPLTVAYSGGTAFNFVNNTPDPGIQNFQTYIDSQRHLQEEAAAAGASIIMSNHSSFDQAVLKIRLMSTRGNGPHPFVVGEAGVQRYLEVNAMCARAAQILLEERAAKE
jgi:metallo-beta-lactamase class B